MGSTTIYTHNDQKERVGNVRVATHSSPRGKFVESGSVKLKPRATGGYVAARSFLGKYGIDPVKYAGRYDPQEVMDENLGKVYVIELKEKKDDQS